VKYSYLADGLEQDFPPRLYGGMIKVLDLNLLGDITKYARTKKKLYEAKKDKVSRRLLAMNSRMAM